MTGRGADFYSGVGEPTGNSIFISRGGADGRVALKAEGDRLFVAVEGEPRGAYLLEAFREGLETGALDTNMRTLVDLRLFTGTVDWSAVFTLRTYASWGKRGGGESSVAYVVRNDAFGALIKIARTLFFSSNHQTFRTVPDAVAWLDSKAKDEARR